MSTLPTYVLDPVLLAAAHVMLVEALSTTLPDVTPVQESPHAEEVLNEPVEEAGTETIGPPALADDVGLARRFFSIAPVAEWGLPYLDDWRLRKAFFRAQWHVEHDGPGSIEAVARSMVELVADAVSYRCAYEVTVKRRAAIKDMAENLAAAFRKTIVAGPLSAPATTDPTPANDVEPEPPKGPTQAQAQLDAWRPIIRQALYEGACVAAHEWRDVGKGVDDQEYVRANDGCSALSSDAFETLGLDLDEHEGSREALYRSAVDVFQGYRYWSPSRARDVADQLLAREGDCLAALCQEAHGAAPKPVKVNKTTTKKSAKKPSKAPTKKPSKAPTKSPRSSAVDMEVGARLLAQEVPARGAARPCDLWRALGMHRRHGQRCIDLAIERGWLVGIVPHGGKRVTQVRRGRVR